MSPLIFGSQMVYLLIVSTQMQHVHDHCLAANAFVTDPNDYAYGFV